MKKNANTNKRSILMILAAGALLLGLGLAQMGQGQGQGRGPGAGAGYAQTAQPLTPEAEAALLEALTGPAGEYAAYAMYTAVLEKYGQVEPYASIQQAEAKHIAAVQRQLDLYGVDYPKTNPYLGQVEAPDSLEEAARAWAEGEISNIEMYDRLLPVVADYPNLVQVFTNLRNASEAMHLPAFQLAAESGGTLTPEQMQQLQQQSGHTHGAGGAGGHGGRGAAAHGGQAAGDCNHTPPAWAGPNAQH